MSDEIKTLLTIIDHRMQVAARLRELARQLEKRADLHDLSKFKPDEFNGFVEFKRSILEHPFGTPEYNKAMAQSQSVIDLHFSRNRHHPEYHSNGISDMVFIDFVEMVVDWLGANATYDDISFRDALDKLNDRYKLTDNQLFLVDLIARFFGE